ncbi:PASTA domain-containing protein, partial [Nocardioides sp. CER28]
AGIVALVLAIALVIWLLLRDGGNDTPPPEPTTPTATATTPTPTEATSPTETARTFDLDEADYVGRDLDEVLADLRGLGLETRTREVANPGDQTAETVTAVSPTRGLQEGDRVEVAYYGRPTPTRSPTTQSPTQEPTTPAPTTTAPPTPPATTPQTAQTDTSTATASDTLTPAARKDMSR